MRRSLALVLLVAGCGGGSGTAEPPARPYGDSSGVSVAEARDRGGRQLVRGSVLARDGETRLCSGLMESFPPQCAEPSLRVEGLDVAGLDGTATGGGATWTEREVTLHGVVEDGVLRVGEP